MPKPSGYAAVTIASKRCLALARATAGSFVEHNPDIPFFLLLADEPDATAAEGPYTLIRLADIALPEPEQFCFRYTEMEFSYALTPYVIAHLLGLGYAGVLFLKQETLVLDDLAPVLARLQRHSALLTPHFLQPPGRSDALAWEINVLRSGVFNGGFLAFSRCAEARDFLKWWQSRTLRLCLHDVANGLHYEQRWLDFAPAFMPGCHILRDPGVNVGHWNLPDRDIAVSDGRVTAMGVPCRVFRFSGYDLDAPERVTRHNRDYTVASTGAAAAVFEDYRRRLLAAGHEACRASAYAFDSYDDGSAIAATDRLAYRRLGDRARAFGDPFETASPASFRRWLRSRVAERQG